MLAIADQNQQATEVKELMVVAEELEEQRRKLIEVYGKALGKAYDIDDSLTTVANYLEYAVDQITEIDDYISEFMENEAPEGWSTGGWIPSRVDPLSQGYYLGYYERMPMNKCEVVFFSNGRWAKDQGGLFYGKPDFWRTLPAVPKRV